MYAQRQDSGTEARLPSQIHRNILLIHDSSSCSNFAEVERLSPPERAERTDRLVETLPSHVPPEIERAQIEEVRRRMPRWSPERGSSFLAMKPWRWSGVASFPTRGKACEDVAAMSSSVR